MGRFNFALQNLNDQVETAISHTKFMSKVDADRYFAQQNLSYQMVLRRINSVYRKLKDSDKWEPAKLPKDRSALTLVHQSKSNGSHSKSTSSNNNNGSNNRRRTNKHKSNNGRFNRQRSDCTGWRFKGPANGEPTTKIVNGQTFHWCTKCFGGAGFWTKTHTTETHTGSSTSASVSASTNFVSVDPSFWSCTITKPKSKPPAQQPVQFIQLPFQVRTKHGKWTKFIPSYAPVHGTDDCQPHSPSSSSRAVVGYFLAFLLGLHLLDVAIVQFLRLILSFISSISSHWYAPALWMLLGSAATLPSLANVWTSIDDVLPQPPSRNVLRRSFRHASSYISQLYPNGDRRYKSRDAHISRPSLRRRQRTTHSLRLRREQCHITRHTPPTLHQRQQARVLSSVVRNRHRQSHAQSHQARHNFVTQRTKFRQSSRSKVKNSSSNTRTHTHVSNCSKCYTSASQSVPTCQPCTASTCQPCRIPTKLSAKQWKLHSKIIKKCQCSSCDNNKVCQHTAQLPRSRTCPHCQTYLGAFDPNEPVQCHHCHSYHIPKSVSNTPKCKCKKPSRNCKNHRCVRHFMRNKKYINHHHVVHASNSHSLHPSSFKPTKSFYKSPKICKSYYDNQDNLCKHMATLPSNVREHILSFMIASVGASKKSTPLAPTKISSTIKDPRKCFKLIWDSGASICVTFDRSDFITFSPTSLQSVKGIGGKQCKISGKGKVRWNVTDETGRARILDIEAVYVPSCNTRLLSISQLLQEYPNETVTANHQHLTLSGSATTAKVTVPYDPSTNLPTTTTSNSLEASKSAALIVYTALTTTAEANHNLSPAEKELLKWHCRLGHIDFNKVKHLMRTGVLSSTQATRQLHSSACKLQHNPKCAACLFAKQTARPMAGKRTTVVKDRAGILRRDNLLPGQEVSVDHFICSTKGRLFTGYNRGNDSNRYCGGCIFCDHASGFVHVEFQSSLSSHDTLQAKESFDKLCLNHGVIVQKFMSDNGTAFTSSQFQDHLREFQQISKFAGAGAHHHNAQAERSIRTIMSISRAMLLHSAIHWPDMANPSLWPMAVSHAVFLWNHVPNLQTGLSAADIFTKSRWPQHRFHDLHVWGCPTYVLDKTIADGMKIPRWKPRSTRCLYLGKSPRHASNVPLVLNPSTGSITGQFHVVFDDWFATVASDCSVLPDFNSDEWKKLFGDSVFQYVTDAGDADNPEDGAPDLSDILDNEISMNHQDRIAATLPASKPLPVPEPATMPSPGTLFDPSMQHPQRTPSLPIPSAPSAVSSRREIAPTTQAPPQVAASQPSFSPSPQPISPPAVPPATSTPAPSPAPAPSSTRPANVIPHRLSSSARPSRARKPVSRLTYDGSKSSYTGKSYNVNLAETSAASDINLAAYFSHLGDLHINKAKAVKDPDTLTYDEAMQDADCHHWIDAAIKEIDELSEHGTWSEELIESVPDHLVVIPGTWVFRRKRNPDGTFKKFKARYCLRGDLENTDVETYSPVVSYWAVRLFLALSLILNWTTITIDFSNAFVQATLEEDTYIHIPRGFKSTLPGKRCLKLIKSLYGKANSPRLWHLHILKILLSLGFKQSQYDACLLLRNDCILILYVDDLGISAKDPSIIDELLNQIKSNDCQFTRQGSFNDYLGIQYTTLEDSSINLTQPGLIKKIIAATGMDRCNPKSNPVTQQALGSHPDSDQMTDPWNYRSLVGMLLYLSGNTRPDLQFAVSQVARFSHDPKQPHANAVKRIIQYLQSSKNDGCIFKKSTTIKLDLYVDADFAGLWGVEHPLNSISVKSRTGFLISLSSCYLLSKSGLQTSIAQSTGEAEYIALSQALRTLLPIRLTLEEILKMIEVSIEFPTSVQTQSQAIHQFDTEVHEDNNSALMLATEQRVTPRTKHYAVKLHWFWSIINDPSNRINIIKIDTKEQQADYLTKGMPTPSFQECRQRSQGW